MLKFIDNEKAFGCTFSNNQSNRNVYCAFCEDEDDSVSASCSVSIKGVFNCRSCGRGGTAIEFYAEVNELTIEEATEELGTDKEPEIAQKERKKEAGKCEIREGIPETCHKDLLNSTVELGYFKSKRGLSIETLKRFNIGKDENRLTIPIYYEDGSLKNIRRYHPTVKPKMVSHDKGDTVPCLYPLTVLKDVESNGEIIICEGEWDAMLLNQNGFPAITRTSGVRTWLSEWSFEFMDKRVIIMFDVNDKKGEGALQAQVLQAALVELGIPTKVITLDLPASYIGGDVTDYFVKEKKTKEDLRKLIKGKEFIVTMEDIEDLPDIMEVPEEEDTGDYTKVSLSEAASAKHYFKKISFSGVVAGRGTAPFLVPKKIQATIVEGEGKTKTQVYEFSIAKGEILSLLSTTKMGQRAFMKTCLGVEKGTQVNISVIQAINVEELFLIPSIDDDSGYYAMRSCYYIGHGLQTNRTYTFKGVTLPDPKTQQATHILTHAEPAESEIDNFSLSEEQIKTLKEVFQAENLHDKLSHIETQMANHITKIYGREDLHLAADLVFHSPLQFRFGGTILKKGWLELLVLGDTRTGKGYVTEGLMKHYKVGDIVSSESLTLAGLIGAVQKIGERWALVWGKIPLSDKRLVILDECTALPTETIGKLSRIRSEGVAEITKVVTEKTTSRTRLIWLGNPRPSVKSSSTRVLSDYNYGIEAINEVIGAAEDIARFDMVLIVAQNEVSSTEINKVHTIKEDLKYSSKDCNTLINWIWSREPDQIKFDSNVMQLVLRASKALGKQFSSRIPLIQAEDVRYKIVRIAVAAAGRVFSTEDGVNLIVTGEHIKFAYGFLSNIYSKPCCGYAQMSQEEKERSTLKDPEAVRDVLEQASENTLDLVSGLMEHNNITAQDMSDFAGIDIFEARIMISQLVRLRAIIKDYNYYKKKPAFKTFLMKIKAELGKDNHLTQPEGAV